MVHCIYKEGEAFKKEDIAVFIQDLSLWYGQDRKIVIFLDNGKYQKNTFVKEVCKGLNIELLWNLSYRPDLNGIEVFWSRAKANYRKGVLKC